MPAHANHAAGGHLRRRGACRIVRERVVALDARLGRQRRVVVPRRMFRHPMQIIDGAKPRCRPRLPDMRLALLVLLAPAVALAEDSAIPMGSAHAEGDALEIAPDAACNLADHGLLK